jgi:proteasome lid subunit RPN8/RPN11
MSPSSANQAKPDISQISLKELPEKPFAQEAEPPLRVVFSPQAHEAVRLHARENTRVEVCGVLVGQVSRDKLGPFLEVADVIRGEHAETKAGQVTFTHKTWEHVNSVMDAQHPGRKIIGWYHSHPGYGVFLSPQDEFIQTNFFPQPWQVAFVFDPLAEEDGFFIWQQGKPCRMQQYWIGGEKKVHSADLAALRAGLKRNMDEIRQALPKAQRKGVRLIPFLLAILLLAVLLLASLLQSQRYFRQLTALQEMAVKQNIPLPLPTDNLVRRLKEDKRLGGVEVRLIRLGPFLWCEGEALTYAQKEVVGKILKSAEGVQSVDTSGLQVTHEYVTGAGETLTSIALKVYGQAARWQDIFNANRDKVTDPARLRPYSVLRLPE